MTIVHFLLFALVCIPLIILFKKLSLWFFDKVEDVLPSIITMPFIFWGLSKVIQFYIVPDINSDTLGFVSGLIFIFFCLSLYALVYLFEKTGEYMCQQPKVWRFFIYLILSLVSLALIFACQYDLLNAYYKDSFANVPEGSWWSISIEFFFFSFGILLANPITSIECISMLAKFFCLIESLLSFIVLVFLISYYKEIGEIFHHSDKESQRAISESKDKNKSKIQHPCKLKHKQGK